MAASVSAPAPDGHKEQPSGGQQARNFQQAGGVDAGKGQCGRGIHNPLTNHLADDFLAFHARAAEVVGLGRHALWLGSVPALVIGGRGNAARWRYLAAIVVSGRRDAGLALAADATRRTAIAGAGRRGAVGRTRLASAAGARRRSA